MDKTSAFKSEQLRECLMYWLFFFSPTVVDGGKALVWRGYADDDRTFWVRIRIEKAKDARWDSKGKPILYSISTDCNIPVMKDWMDSHKKYLLSKLIWYYKALWDVIHGWVETSDCNKSEDDIDWDEQDTESEEGFDD